MPRVLRRVRRRARVSGCQHNRYASLLRPCQRDISLAAIKRKFDPYSDERLRSGRMREEAIVAEFEAQIESGERDGRVALEEFIAYYTDVSAAVEEDQAFAHIMREAWAFNGGKGWEKATANALAQGGLRPPELAAPSVRDFARAISPPRSEQSYGGSSDASSRTASSMRSGSVRGSGKGRRLLPHEAASRPRAAWPPAHRAANNAPFDCGDDFDLQSVSSSQASSQRNGQREVGRPAVVARPGAAARALHDADDRARVADEDPWMTLWRLVYKPPCTCEELMHKLNVSSVPPNRPRIPTTALAARLRQLDRSLPEGLALRAAKAAESVSESSGTNTAGSRRTGGGTTSRAMIVDVEEFHKCLAARFGRDTSSAKPSSLFERVRKLIWQQASDGSVSHKEWRP